MAGREKMNVYESIVARIRAMIDAGVLKEGDKLPSVRAYAVENRVNPNTVAKAYAALEEEGYIKIQLKKGAYVASRGKSADAVPWEEIVAQLRRWRLAGVTEHDLQEALREAYRGEEERKND